MTGKEHWQRSMGIYFREENRKREPAKLREELEKGAKEISEEISSHVKEKGDEQDDYAKKFREDVKKIKNRLSGKS